jgi:transcriptional regulator with XRE-family HTH domain
MATFNTNINARRLALGLTYEDVWSRMSDRKYSEGVDPPSISAVGNWFNGQRRPRHMEHLLALCDVLQISIEDAAGSDGLPVTDTQAALLQAVHGLSDAQIQALLALAHTMKPK